MHNTIFFEISALLVISAIISMIMRALRQPLIIGYILTGLIVGPALLGFIKSPEAIEGLGSFGVALLLFIVGLGLNPKVIKEVGKVSLLTGLGQIIFTSLVGFFILRYLEFNVITSFYVAVALTFSSTIIILKLLSDKKEENKLYGKIAIGFLLVQDVVATFALVVASASANGRISPNQAGVLAAKGIGLILMLFFVSRFIVKPLTRFLSRSQEVLFLFALAWGLGIATLFYETGFSLEVGALIAGVSLASLPYAQEIGSRLRPLRDFFIVVFFISLGSRLNIGDVADVWGYALGLSAFVLVGNPIIVMIIMGLMGYTKKNSFKAGLTVAQISEFSLIFVLLGFRNGQVEERVVSLVTVVGLITIAVSSYMIIYSNGLYRIFERYLSLFERRKLKSAREFSKHYDAILLGYQRGGHDFIPVIKKLTNKYIVVDYDPDAIDILEKHNVPYIYGDATDPEMLEEINFESTKIIVSLITDFPTNVFLLKELERLNPNAVVVCHAESVQQAVELYGLGASYVVMPHFVGNEQMSAFIRKNGFKKTEFKKYKHQHIAYLQDHFQEVL